MKAFKIGLLSTVFAFGISAAASAADIYQGGGSYKDEPATYYPAITWTGFYIGGHAGAAFDDVDENDSEFVGGLQAGYNWQADSPLLLGIEGDIGFIDDVDYLATIRGRIGYAAGNALVYGTGGAAFLGVDDGFDDDETITGWVAGGGLEYKLFQNTSVGIQGLYYSLDDDDSGEGDFWTVTGRLNYHLTGGYNEPLR